MAAVETGSMEPALHKTDAVLVWPTKSNNVKPGQVISVFCPAAGTTITHRLRTVTAAGDLVTKGDANSQADAPTSPKYLKGRVVAVFPGLGSLLDEMRRPTVLLGLLYVPCAIIVAAEAYSFAAAWRAPYRYPGYAR